MRVTVLTHARYRSNACDQLLKKWLEPAYFVGFHAGA
jgi:hypothetical protein